MIGANRSGANTSQVESRINVVEKRLPDAARASITKVAKRSLPTL